ncbi:hypothetical protein LCGC14_3008690, partial [marine sediment metagenome]
MVELIEWQKALVIQKDHRFGAIVAGYEWMIRHNKIKDISFETFQDDFNLQAKDKGKNDFDPIANAVSKKYPNVRVKFKNFKDGREKVEFVKELISKNVPCMLSLALTSKKNISHEMPITFYDENY